MSIEQAANRSKQELFRKLCELPVLLIRCMFQHHSPAAFFAGLGPRQTLQSSTYSIQHTLYAESAMSTEQRSQIYIQLKSMQYCKPKVRQSTCDSQSNLNRCNDAMLHGSVHRPSCSFKTIPCKCPQDSSAMATYEPHMNHIQYIIHHLRYCW